MALVLVESIYPGSLIIRAKGNSMENLLNREIRIQVSRLGFITILDYNTDKSEKRKKCLSKR